MSRISFSLDADQEAFVNERIAEGHYHDASDYMRELVRRDQERREEAEHLREMLDAAEASGVCEEPVMDIWAEAEAEYLA